MSKRNKQICKMFDDLTQKLHKRQRSNNMLHKKNRIDNILSIDSRNIQSNQNKLLLSNTSISTRETQKSSFSINSSADIRKEETIDSSILISSIIQTTSKVNSFASKFEIRSTNQSFDCSSQKYWLTDEKSFIIKSNTSLSIKERLEIISWKNVMKQLKSQTRSLTLRYEKSNDNEIYDIVQNTLEKKISMIDHMYRKAVTKILSNIVT